MKLSMGELEHVGTDPGYDDWEWNG
jgi:hypothetical protein